MTSFFPGGQDSWAAKVDLVDTILASHVNDLQNAVASLEIGGVSKQNIAYAASITPDVPAGEYVIVGTLTGNITINAPTNTLTGRRLTFRFTQDGSGGRTVTWNVIFKATNWVLNAAANAVTEATCTYDGANWFLAPNPLLGTTTTPVQGVVEEWGNGRFNVQSPQNPSGAALMDGSSDDAAAVTGAANAIPSAGGIIDIPAGLLLLASTVTLKANTTVRGAGKDVTIVRARAGFTSNGWLFNGNNKDNIRFENLTLDGATPWAAPVIATAAGTSLTIGDYSVAYTFVTGQGESVGRSAKSTQSATTQTSLTLTANNQVIAVSAINGLPSYVTALKFYFVNSAGTAGFISQQTVTAGTCNAFNITTQGNGVAAPSATAGTGGVDASTANTGFQAFKLKTLNTGQSGIRVSTRSRVSVIDSHFENSQQYGIEAFQSSPTNRASNYEVIGNTFLNCDSVETIPGAMLFGHCDDLRVKGNTVTTAHSGAAVEGCTRAVVAENTMTLLRDSGIRISPPDTIVAGDYPYDYYTVVAGNTIKTVSQYHGIVCRGNRIVVIGNYINGAATYGIDCGAYSNNGGNAPYPGSHWNVIVGNTIEGCGQEGIDFNVNGMLLPQSAPVISAVAGGSLTNGSYTLGYTYVTADGETAVSPTSGTATPAGGTQQIQVNAISSIPSGVSQLKFYWITSPGTAGFISAATQTVTAGATPQFNINTQGTGASSPALTPVISDIICTGNIVKGCGRGGISFINDANGSAGSAGVNGGLIGNMTVEDNHLSGNTGGNGNISVLGAAPSNTVASVVIKSSNRIRNNNGVNPLGSITAPAVPASTAASATQGVDCTVYVSTGAGVTVSVIAVGGATITGITMAQNSTSGALRVPAGQTIALTYAGGTPTWQWFSDN